MTYNTYDKIYDNTYDKTYDNTYGNTSSVAKVDYKRVAAPKNTQEYIMLVKHTMYIDNVRFLYEFFLLNDGLCILSQGYAYLSNKYERCNII